ncbi:MAG: hypothetical protein Q8K60_02735 [Parachlamydiaceae bacterium]|nr:hypothetical protein [Parachlamydiaceae bacterium]
MLISSIIHEMNTPPTSSQEVVKSSVLRTVHLTTAYLTVLKLTSLIQEAIQSSFVRNLMNGKKIIPDNYQSTTLMKLGSLKGVGYAITAIFILVVIGTTAQTIYASSNKKNNR